MLRILLVAVLGCALDGAAAADAGPSPQAKFAEAVARMGANNFADAVPLLDDLADSYPTSTVFWNLGLSATETGDNAKALKAWRAYRAAAPNNWQGRAKLVQAYQALGNLEARDRERAALVALWKQGIDGALAKQEVFCREQFRYGGRKLMALEYFDPAGPKIVVYSFNVLDAAGDTESRISLGSYELTNQIALELGERPKDKRLYHLDQYQGSTHRTFGFFLGQPSYEVVRAAALDVLSGKSQASSSSTIGTR